MESKACWASFRIPLFVCVLFKSSVDASSSNSGLCVHWTVLYNSIAIWQTVLTTCGLVFRSKLQYNDVSLQQRANVWQRDAQMTCTWFDICEAYWSPAIPVESSKCALALLELIRCSAIDPVLSSAWRVSVLPADSRIPLIFLHNRPPV